MHWHIESDVICSIILIILYVAIKHTDYSTVRHGNLFKFIIVYTIIVTITDILSGIALMIDASWFIAEAVTELYYCLAPGILALWFYYGYSLTKPQASKKNKIFMAVCSAPYVIYLFIALNNPFTGWIFELTDNMEFKRGLLFYMCIATYAFYGILVCAMVIVKNKSISPKGNIGILISCPMAMGMALLLQLIIPNILVVSAACTMVFMVTYIFIESRRVRDDGLTGVALRQFGEQQIMDVVRILTDRKKGIFIISDIDNFKNINDYMGHAFGDIALKEMATAFRAVLPEHSIISRFGGDEFVVFMEIKEQDRDISKYLDEIRKILEKKVCIKEPDGSKYGMTISVGIAEFPTHGETLHELYEHADEAMRFVKRQGKNQNMVYNDELRGFINEAS